MNVLDFIERVAFENIALRLGCNETNLILLDRQLATNGVKVFEHCITRHLGQIHELFNRHALFQDTDKENHQLHALFHTHDIAVSIHAFKQGVTSLSLFRCQNQSDPRQADNLVNSLRQSVVYFF